MNMVYAFDDSMVWNDLPDEYLYVLTQPFSDKKINLSLPKGFPNLAFTLFGVCMVFELGKSFGMMILDFNIEP